MVTARVDARRIAGLLAMSIFTSGCDVIFGIEDGQLQPVTIVPVVDNIKGEVTWTADTVRSLSRVIFVESGATLTIEPGTTILAERNSALVVLRGGTIIACGNETAPIVFTSAQDPRAPGDWGGLLVLGDARTIPLGVAIGAEEVSGMDANGLITTFGGMRDDDDSGELCYVRIEFGGAEINTLEEYPGLGLFGVGSGTEVHHIQVHAAGDNGIEIVGGAVSPTYLMATRAGDGMKWTSGWHGRAQFIAIVMGGTGDTYGDGLQGENDGDTLTPSEDRPMVYNATIVGSPASGNNAAGLVFSDGAKAYIGNTLISDYAGVSFDILDAATYTNANDTSLDVTYSIFASVNNFDEQTVDNDMGNFDELTWAMDSARMNQELPPSDVGLKSTDLGSLDLSVNSGSPALTGGTSPPSGFDTSADHVGACSDTCSDFQGWTAFPEN